MKSTRLKTALTLFGIATCLILFTTTQRTVMSITQGEVPRRLPFLVADAANYYFWAAVAFPIYSIASWLAGRELNRGLLFLAHLILSFAFGLLNIAVQGLSVSLVSDQSILQIIQSNFYAKLTMRVAFYFLILIACSVWIEMQRRKREESKARELENQLAVAQFQVLKSQLSPRFLFQTLNNISDLLKKDIEEADRLTARLGDFLRLSLESTCATCVALQDEIELVKSYLEIRRFNSPHVQMALQIEPHLIASAVPGRVLFDLVQTAEPEQKFELSAFMDRSELVLCITGLNRITDDIETWRHEEGKLCRRIPLSWNSESENFRTNPFFQSLDEFHSSIAQKQRRVQHAQPSRIRRILATMMIWTIAGLFFMSSEILTRHAYGQPLQFFETLRDSLAWYWWAAFTPLIFFLSRKFPLKAGSLKNSVYAHLLFSLATSFSMVFLYLFQRWALGLDVTRATTIEILVGYPYVFDALTYWGILGVHEGLIQRWQYLQEDVRTAKLKGNLLEAQVQALKMQLHPHFLFNALNSISELMHEDLQAAHEMLKRLADFLRLTFENADIHEITLRSELDYLRNYLEIQQVRFQNRLQIELKIDPAAMHDRVPNLILQPIVENAIQHGVSPRMDSGKVEIRAFHRGGNLYLQVEDDGPGLKSGSFREGVGMSNTRMRLKQIYGKNCQFGVSNNPGGGLVVTLQIPANEMRLHD